MNDVRRISTDEASARLAEGFIYVDVRSAEEFESGHPARALNVPFMHAVQGTMQPNREFVEVMKRAFSTDTRLVLGCASGTRSAAAATALAAAGFLELLELRAGFNGVRDPFGQLVEKGWLAAGLPVSLASAGTRYADVKQRT